jgi:hypothetical protein
MIIANKSITYVLNPDYIVGFLFLSKTPSNIRACSFRELHVGVTMFALAKPARGLVFFGVLNLMHEIS